MLGARNVVLFLVTIERGWVGPSEGELASLDIFHAHTLPVKEVAQTLRPVALVDALATALLCKVKHARGKLVDRVVHTLVTAVDDVDTIIARVLNQLLHVAAKTGKVGCDAGHTHHGAFGWRVAPWLVVRRKDTQVCATHKVVVVKREHRVRRVQELWVEDDLDAVRWVVEELYPTDLVQNRILAVVDHVVRDNRGKSVSLHGKETATKQDTVLAGEDLLVIRHRLSVVPLEGAFENASANVALNRVHGVSEGLDNGLALEGLHGQRGGLGGHDDKGNDGGLAARALEAVVQTGEGLDEHVYTLIPELVATSREEVESVFRIEIVVTIEVTADKVVDLLLGLLVKVLELVHGGELGDVETIGQHSVGLALQEMLALVRGNVRDGGEDITGVSRRPLDAVPMIDTALASLGVDVKVLQVVVEIDRAGAEVPTEKRSVGGEDGGNINTAPLAQRKGDTGEPLVEVGNDSLLLFVAHKLEHGVSETVALGGLSDPEQYLSKEPCDKVTKHNSLVCFLVIIRGGDRGHVPQIRLPLVQIMICGFRVKEKDSWRTLDQPATIQNTNATIPHGLNRRSKLGVGGFDRLDLDGRLKGGVSCMVMVTNGG